MSEPFTHGDRYFGAFMIFVIIVAVITLPLWLIPVAVWLIASRHKVESCT